MNTQDWVKEMTEFVNAARIFKPLTGSMATRFTSSSSSNIQGNMDQGLDTEALIHRPSTKEEDPAEAAAKVSMYGPLTRSVIQFTPNRLLCKRFNVPYTGPTGSQEDAKSAQAPTTTGFDLPKDADTSTPEVVPMRQQQPPKPVQVDAERNEALESEKAADEVFKNIFGDSDSDSDD
jgi:G patch domain-containing protein 1